MSDYEEPRPRGTNWGKVALGCGAAAVILVVLAIAGAWWWVSSSTTTDPAEIATLTAEIAPGATIPAGYQGVYGFEMFGVKMVIIDAGREHSSDGRLAILLGSAPGGKGTSMLEQMREGRPEFAGAGDAEIEELGRETFVVAGMEVDLHKSRSTAAGEAAFLHYIGTWRSGDEGEVAVMIAGAEESFDRPAMDAFLGSIVPAGK